MEDEKLKTCDDLGLEKEQATVPLHLQNFGCPDSLDPFEIRISSENGGSCFSHNIPPATNLEFFFPSSCSYHGPHT